MVVQSMLQQLYRSLKETEARIGEIFRLKWDNIDFESRTIKITPKIWKGKKLIQMPNELLKTQTAFQAWHGFKFL